MSGARQRVLTGLFAVLAIVAAAVLFDVLGTVFFAITVAYVLTPLHRWLVERGVSRWMASAVATVVAFVGVLLAFLSAGFLLYRRQTELLALLGDLPESLTFELLGFVYVLDASVVFQFVRANTRDFALAIARLAPVLALKFTLFALLVFALLVRRKQAHRALLGLVPPKYRDIAASFEDRTRETLFAIYVLQAATAAGTFLLALPVFYVLGYEFFVTLALFAGFLQFLPIVGPSFLLAVLAAYRVTVGDVPGALLVVVFGGVLVAWLPDAVIRPRLAQETAHLPGSLYFVGFTGGLLSLGPVGFIAGPLVVALLVEAAELLSVEVNGEGA
ncbi:AI-2E family transporter [Halorussus halophilus]|uniref:AI-2E family transporter n=1 Tax=Halorussus halophilus TaxID=2650975 RepID=UPI0013018715|nr:AI-2E family transporter [Halorussus halophilus]